MGYRLGIDIGGTFTDVTLIDDKTGQVWIDKVASTPKDPSIGFLQATHRILAKSTVSPSEVDYLVHGTTVATNSIIEGKLARTGFITTDGFRDMLEIGRQTRPAIYDLQCEKPRPLVPRHHCFGIPERLDYRGEVLVPLDEAAVREAARRLREDGVESVAVCLLHSCLNPSPEKRIGEILREELPSAIVSLSSEVAPEFREYLRASTTVINACIRPVVVRYLESIERGLTEEGLTAELLMMQSSGGVFTFAAARERPVFMVECGPAAGVIAAAYLGGKLDSKDVIAFDMGGTTTKAGLIQNGSPKLARDYEVGATARAGVGTGRGAGYPIRTPVIDLVEIGAGGGSIARVDSGGALRVGPQSAGADPGPVCYGWGGTEPTVTDANLVLGRLNPKYFVGGEIQLDTEAARKAIKERCADKLGMDVAAVAHAIVEIANAAMVNALRLVSVQRGYDPRDFALVGFGGAGPMHADRLAAEMGIPRAIIPLSPGIFTSLGLLVTDLKHDYSCTFIQQISKLDLEAVESAYRRMELQGREVLLRESIAPEEITFLRFVDMRFVGQSYELTIGLKGRLATTADVDRVRSDLLREHDRVYGFSAPEQPMEFVNLRLTAIGSIAKPQLRELPGHGGSADSARKGTRAVYFGEAGGYVDSPVYDRYQLAGGVAFDGPAIVEEFDSTIVIHPGRRAHVDRYGNITLSK